MANREREAKAQEERKNQEERARLVRIEQEKRKEMLLEKQKAREEARWGCKSQDFGRVLSSLAMTGWQRWRRRSERARSLNGCRPSAR